MMIAKQKMTGLNGDEASAFATKQVDPDVVAEVEQLVKKVDRR